MVSKLLRVISMRTIVSTAVIAAVSLFSFPVLADPVPVSLESRLTTVDRVTIARADMLDEILVIGDGMLDLGGRDLTISAGRVLVTGTFTIRSHAPDSRPSNETRRPNARPAGATGSGCRGRDCPMVGGPGGAGQTGENGRAGRAGQPSGRIELNFARIAFEEGASLRILAVGQAGGRGGQGGEGGPGGVGGQGRDRHDARIGRGGRSPGDGGKGGRGGNGGTGGAGGSGGAGGLVLLAPVLEPYVQSGNIMIDVSGGPGGAGGPGGEAGRGAPGGQGGAGSRDGHGGVAGPSGSNGSPGATGQAGAVGRPGSFIFN